MISDMEAALIAKVSVTYVCECRVVKRFACLLLQLCSILEATLTKLSRYDEGTFLAPILSITVCCFMPLFASQLSASGLECDSVRSVYLQYKQGVSSSGKEFATCYINFVHNCIEQLRHKILDELLVLTVLEVRPNERRDDRF